jgi:hypothetical protein
MLHPLLHPHTGEDVLSWLSFGHTSIPKTLGAEARILAFYYWATFCILKAGKPKFEALQPPPVAGAAALPAPAGTAAAAANGGSRKGAAGKEHAKAAAAVQEQQQQQQVVDQQQEPALV